MLKEFAVDPRVIASSFETCRYLISQFGADKGRLISKFPKQWKRMAFDAAAALPDGLSKERVVEFLTAIDSEWLTLSTSNRAYTAPAESWLDNAIAAHRKTPFQAIVTDQDDSGNQLLDANGLNENNPLFAAQRTRAVKRTANELAQAAALLLQNCRQLRLVDRYFDPGEAKWRDSLGAILSLIPDITRVECEYHVLERDKSPSTAELVQRLQDLKGVIPVEGKLRVVRWREKPAGEWFHDRYLLTNNAGLSYGGGLDPAIGADQTTNVMLLDRNLHQQRWNEYDRDSQVFELFKPVLVVDSAGQVAEEG